MTNETEEWRPFTRRPASDVPTDMPAGEVTVDVPIHPQARATKLDTRFHFRLISGSYVKAAEPVSYEVPLDIGRMCEWFQGLFVHPDYRCHLTVGHFGRSGELIAWTVLDVTPSGLPDVTIQLTLRALDEASAIVTYRVEQHPVPPRDSDSYLPMTVERVEVEYTFLNVPERIVRRAITDKSEIGTLVEVLNTFPRDIRFIAHGRMMDRLASLRFIARDGAVMPVYVDPAHDSIRIGEFPALLGNVWELLNELAPPGAGAGGRFGD
ncbi:MAG: hypothetical protein ACR2GA_05160 [Chloroflexota bacterium]